MRELYAHPAFRLPFLRRFSAMTLAPFCILYREAEEDVEPLTRRHEAEHLAQARRVGLLTFYGTYLWDWARGLVRTRSLDAAYRAIRWEVEAYAAQHDPCWPTECADLPTTIRVPSISSNGSWMSQRSNAEPSLRNQMRAFKGGKTL